MMLVSTLSPLWYSAFQRKEVQTCSRYGDNSKLVWCVNSHLLDKYPLSHAKKSCLFNSILCRSGGEPGIDCLMKIKFSFFFFQEEGIVHKGPVEKIIFPRISVCSYASSSNRCFGAHHSYLSITTFLWRSHHYSQVRLQSNSSVSASLRTLVVEYKAVYIYICFFFRLICILHTS